MSKAELFESGQNLTTLVQSVMVEAENLSRIVNNMGATWLQYGCYCSHRVMIFLLACFVGYYIAHRVIPAFHTLLMSITSTLSSVILIGALWVIFSGPASTLGYIALTAATLNMLSGFVVTHRVFGMLVSQNNKL